MATDSPCLEVARVLKIVLEHGLGFVLFDPTHPIPAGRGHILNVRASEGNMVRGIGSFLN